MSDNPYQSPQAQGKPAKAERTTINSIWFGCFSGAAGFAMVMFATVGIQWRATGVINVPWKVFAVYFCLSTGGGGLAGVVLSRFYTVRR